MYADVVAINYPELATDVILGEAGNEYLTGLPYGNLSDPCWHAQHSDS